MTMLHCRVLVVLVGTALSAAAGCTDPQPAKTVSGGPPPPPPAPAPDPPPTPKVEPDPYEAYLADASKILKRYPAVYADVRDEESADKAVQEIGQMSARLRELATSIAKTPYRREQDKLTLQLQAELTQLAQSNSQEMQRVFADPDMALKFLPLHQGFLLEGVGAIGQAVLSRQPSPPQQPGKTATTEAGTAK